MPQATILLGVIGRPHGVRGLVHVTSYTDPPEAIAGYGPLSDDDGRRFVLRWHGGGVAEIDEIIGGKPARVTDRAAAQRLIDRRLCVGRDRLPQPGMDEYYLADLLGLAAIDAAGASIGKVVGVHDYGAGASLEIAGDRSAPLLVPFTRAAVPAVDVGAGRVTIVPPGQVDGFPGRALPPAPSRKARGDKSAKAKSQPP